MPDTVGLGSVGELKADIARLQGLLDACEARRTAERAAAATEHARLTFELGHRVRNTLSVVQSLASQTLRGAGPMDEALEVFGSRVLALARANDVILDQSWTTATITSVADSVLRPFDTRGDRLDIGGPDTSISASSALSLAMALNELASNAKRHGAWSQPGGRVTLAWQTEPSETGHAMTLTWTESGGPAAVEPAKRGFGLKLIQQSLRSAFGRDVTITLAPSGLVCAVRAAPSTTVP